MPEIILPDTYNKNLTWGKKYICVGLKDDLEPILEPCTGCDGSGWIAYKYVEPKEIE